MPETAVSARKPGEATGVTCSPTSRLARARGHGPPPKTIDTSSASLSGSKSSWRVTMRTSTSPITRRISVSRGSSQKAAKPKSVATVSVWAPPMVRAASTARASAASASPVALARCRHASVGVTPRQTRSNSGTPSFSSNAAICRLTADWVRPSSRAAAVKPRCRTAASSTANCCRGGNRGRDAMTFPHAFIWYGRVYGNR